ncbi:MAG: ABC transporter ATP-binding protein [Candidatus Bathyarchaeota archaeon]|nr:ABC transporter ATP-binding protein [Candidatus Bathyarchaeota archaeon]MDH5686358.1 ABC transporter ATP-binding protein [Candidatus Bathyarchaeota archaeon]
MLFDIDTKVGDKEITVLVGPNGSGKSTLLKTIMGITQVYSGKILFNGNNILGQPPHAITRLGIAYLPQVGNVFADLKVKENLVMASYILSRNEAKKRTDEVLEEFPILKGYIDRRAGTLSGGERQMLAMAMAMMRRPTIMLFDEPTASLAPKIAIEVLNKIVGLREKFGMTVVLAEQNARRALEHGDQAILLVSGRVMYEGGSKELLNHEELGKVYLGIKTD